MTELKPCPFCGEESNIYLGNSTDGYIRGTQYVEAYCNKCGARIKRHLVSEAIEAWNKRSNSWHTEPPTEEGDYVVLCSTDGEYMVCHLEANLRPEIFHKFFKAWWGEKIEPYKEKE